MLNDKYGMNAEWPAKYEVDAHTYACVCKDLFDHLSNSGDMINRNLLLIKVHLGPNNGPFFKGVELILKLE